MKRDLVTTSAEIEAGGTNYNVKIPYTLPNGYGVIAVTVFATSGCDCNYCGFSNGEIIVTLRNPTSVVRTPTINGYILLMKS